MKTSNKLLISLGIFLFIIPLMGMMLTSKMYYKTVIKNNNMTDSALNNQPFKEKTEGRAAISIRQPFHSVNIMDANKSSVELYLIQENNYGVKIPDYLVENLDFKVVNGVLNIFFKNGLSIPDSRNRVMIIVYAPYFKSMSAKRTANLNLITISDSLNINLKDCKYLSIGKDLNALTIVKTLNGDTVSNETYNKTFFKNLNINLDNSKLGMSSIELDHLNIKAQNNSTIEMEGAGPNIKESTIEHFHLTTIGKNNVKINNFNPKEMKEEISDETILEVPTLILRRIFKK